MTTVLCARGRSRRSNSGRCDIHHSTGGFPAGGTEPTKGSWSKLPRLGNASKQSKILFGWVWGDFWVGTAVQLPTHGRESRPSGLGHQTRFGGGTRVETLNSGDVARVRDVLDKFGKMPVSAADIDTDADLYDNGLTSHASVNVMIALEDEFDVEFPDTMLQKSTFGSIDAIATALAQLTD
ncbi:hypothetical protein CH304_06480 [Rhodococcus sp. 15-649-1-2]|nr:hypothetical protein CH267_04125 [Rhodococcus sp. 06-621-2]OZC78596.1 hypothetical protein CH282_22825 [Rhodococcus sp. 06-418-1B]OZD10893.1 hypothetical protein CH280_21835 [Rhodococcus sp. 06-156-4C]OZD11448.1 hypothetical protein CH253_29125 [Rhodococcus sp. 06-156-3C]OZD13683.1 hypothetical protein CH248_26630 [Rhodococcus sp. 06-156-4a]OZD28172.1 hypothetical protein CH247_20530 [Rhodococcus sp. 06-156-3b]OZD30307.1 hypothetical protein CH284_25210 [Rhodococcus sp. 06-156-3]OZE84808.